MSDEKLIHAVTSLEFVMRCMAERSGLQIPERPELPPNRYGFGNIQNPESQGVWNSGKRQKLTPGGAPQQVLKISGGQQDVNRGVAAVHVSCIDASSRVIAHSNQKVVLHVKWQTGNGGGQADVDCTQGTYFTVNGADVIDATAEIVTTGPDVLDPGQDKFVEASVQWGGKAPHPAYVSSTRVLVLSGIDSTVIPIPAQAARLMVFSNQTAAVTTIAKFTDASGTVVYYTSDFQRVGAQSNQVPVVSGAEGLVLNANHDGILLPMWELYL